jgi:hypothetical protein
MPDSASPANPAFRNCLFPVLYIFRHSRRGTGVSKQFPFFILFTLLICTVIVIGYARKKNQNRQRRN